MKIENLKGHIPDVVLEEIKSVIEKFQINTPLRLAHFLSQCCHESARFTAKVENLNYGEPGLLSTFGKYFDKITVKSYARNQEKIASRVYANRMGNGDELSKEGYKFRGRGYIQLTGKNNYVAFGKEVGLDLTVMPDLVSNKFPLLSAAWFFSVNGINEISDKGSTEAVVLMVTKKVNGGSHGLSERIKYFEKFYNVLK